MKDGNCYPCHVLNTNHIDWERRLFDLKSIIEKLKSKNSSHDCLLGVSGGKDSTTQSLWAREKLGLNPLLVSISYPPLQSTELGYKNLENLLKLGFDIITIQPAPITSCKLSKEAFLSQGNVLSYSEMALFSQVPRYAIECGINLILWGENVSMHVGDTGTLKKNIFDANGLYKMNTLTKIAKNLKLPHEASTAHLNSYIYPTEKELKKNNINIVYLGPAMESWSMLNNGLISVLNGFSPNSTNSNLTGDYTKVAMLDEEFTHINNMIKYYKFGFGRATEFVCESIRLGHISREKAIKIVKKYDGVCSDKIISKYCKYIEIKVDDFWYNVHKFTNKKLFKITNKTRPIPKFEVGINYE